LRRVDLILQESATSGRPTRIVSSCTQENPDPPEEVAPEEPTEGGPPAAKKQRTAAEILKELSALKAKQQQQRQQRQQQAGRGTSSSSSSAAAAPVYELANYPVQTFQKMFVLNRDNARYHVCIPYRNGHVEIQVGDEHYEAACNPESLGRNPKVYAEQGRLMRKYEHQ
jgi:hypothetical protein